MFMKIIPVVFQTRWAMSYLRGPLTRTQIKSLVNPSKKQIVEEIKAQTTGITIAKPNLPKEIKPLFLKRDIDENQKSDYSYQPFISHSCRRKIL